MSDRKSEPILSIRGLRVRFRTSQGIVRAVDGVDFRVEPGETMAVLGESGSGKSVTALAMMRLVPTPPGEIVSGEIRFEGKDILKMRKEEVRRLRGCAMAMIFQEPMSSLNPAFTIGQQITEAIRLHQGLRGKEALDKAIEMLNLVKIPSPEKRVHEYPHQLSGGMKQRVMIAMALSCRPKLLIADEPTASLDVTIQAQILELMKELRRQVGTTTLLITHSLGVAAEMADRATVMYAGQVVEVAPIRELFHDARHPYTRGLLKSIVNIKEDARRLDVIPGAPPNPTRLPEGCRFHPRCAKADRKCCTEEPRYVPAGEGRWVRCWYPES